MNFKGVSLAAGLATRLRPITSDRPKAAVPVLGIPSLYFSFYQFANNGFKSWAVNAHHHADQVESLVNAWPGEHKLFVSREDEIQGSGGCYPPLAQWRGDDPLYVYNPDILCDFDISSAMEVFREQDPLAMVIYTLSPPPDGNASVHIDSAGSVTALSTNTPAAGSKAVYGAGMFLLSDRLLKKISPGVSSLTGHLQQGLKQGEKIMALPHEGFWFDMGDSHARYFAAQKAALSHLHNNPKSIFSAAVKNLWQQLSFEPVFIKDPKPSSTEPHSLIDKRIKISQNTKIGPACFLYGDFTLPDDGTAENCVAFGNRSAPLPDALMNQIIVDEHLIDVSIQ